MRVNQAEQNPRPRYKPYGEYKDSGVEWMGEIPAHWEVKRIKHVATKIGSGKTPSGGAEVYLNEGIMLVRSQNVHFGGLRLDDVAFVDEATDREMANTRVLENDVLLNITGASLGRCCLARLAGRRANVNQHVCIIRPRQTQFDPSALSSALTSNALQAQIFNNENGISRDALNFVQIGNFAVCKPTLQEQQAITAFLDRETETVDRDAPGEAQRPHHPGRHQGPRPERPHEGLRRRMAGRDPGTLGSLFLAPIDRRHRTRLESCCGRPGGGSR